MKKLLQSSFVCSFIADFAINCDRIAAKIPIMQDDSTPFFDLCVKMKLRLTEQPQL